MKQEYTIYTPSGNRTVTGYPMPVEGLEDFQFAVVKDDTLAHYKWIAIEVTTGWSIGVREGNRKSAIEDGTRRLRLQLEQKGIDGIRAAIERNPKIEKPVTMAEYLESKGIEMPKTKPKQSYVDHIQQQAISQGFLFETNLEFNGLIWAYALTGTHECERKGTRYFDNIHAVQTHLHDCATSQGKAA